MAARMYDNPIQTDHKLQSVIILQTTKQIKHTKTASKPTKPTGISYCEKNTEAIEHTTG